MRHLILLLFSFLLSIQLSTADHLTSKLTFYATMEGEQVVPPPTTDAAGLAAFTLNATRDSLCVNISASGLSGSISEVAIYEGNFGSTGTMAYDLTPYVSNNRVMTYISGTDLQNIGIASLLDSSMYVIIKTSDHPDGELRGQILLETDWNFKTDLATTNEVPPVIILPPDPQPFGLGSFNLAKHDSILEVRVIVNDMTGPITGAHLHQGDENTNGPIVLNLTHLVNGDMIVGEANLDTGLQGTDAATFLQNLWLGNIYLNIHTDNNPGGEVRDQLHYNASISHDAWLAGDNVVPSVTTGASGVFKVDVNYERSEVSYHGLMQGFNSAITSAKLYEGEPGGNGVELLDLTGDVNGNEIMGTLTGAPVTISLINKFLRGDVYLQIATNDNPNGEIRGQVWRLAREGYVFSLDGEQQVPSTSTPASGTALASVDRGQTNLRYQLVASGLQSSFTGAAFREAAIGNVGPVIFDFTNDVISTAGMIEAQGYWKQSDIPAFTAAMAQAVANHQVYVEVTTNDMPNGEIRGQVTRDVECFNMLTGIFSPTVSADMKLYPNPVDNQLNFEFDHSVKDGILTITDVLGRDIITKNLNYQQGSTYRLDVSDLKEGVYIFSIEENENEFTMRFVKR